jgi:hypothetical protein
LGRWEKFRRKLLSGASDRNIRFSELIGYVRDLGFDVHVQGSHHVCSKPDLVEKLVLQPLPDGNAKLYQVKQVRALVQQYGLGAEDDEI